MCEDLPASFTSHSELLTEGGFEPHCCCLSVGAVGFFLEEEKLMALGVFVG